MRRLVMLPLGLAIAFSSACGGSSAASGTTPRTDGCGPHDNAGHSLEVFLAVAREQDRAPLCPGATLTSSDALWVTVELDTASYVRMVFVAPDGNAGELERQDAADQTRSAIFRAPQGLLAREAGQAQLLVVASREPLSEVDPMMGGVIDAIRDSGSLVTREGDVRPPADGTPHGDAMSLDFAPTGLHADFDDKGLAMLLIPLSAGP